MKKKSTTQSQLDLGAETKANKAVESITTISQQELWALLDQRQAEGKDLEQAFALVQRFTDTIGERMQALQQQHLELKKRIVDEYGVYLPLSIRMETKKGTPSRSFTWFATHFRKSANGKSHRYFTRIRMFLTKDKADPAQLAKETTAHDRDLVDVTECVARVLRADAKTAVNLQRTLRGELKRFRERHEELDQARLESLI